MRAFLQSRFKFPATFFGEERLQTIVVYGALSFMALIVIVTLPYRPF